jgi:hypothetical protein
MKFRTLFVILALICGFVFVRCEADSNGLQNSDDHDHSSLNVLQNMQTNDNKKTNSQEDYQDIDLELEKLTKNEPNKEEKALNNNLEDSVLLNSERESNLIEHRAHEKQITSSPELQNQQEPKKTEHKTEEKVDEHLENDHGNHTHTEEVKDKESEEISTNQIVKFIVLIGVMIVVTAALITLVVLVIRNRNKKSSSNQTHRKPRKIYHPVNQTDSNI